MCCFLILQVGNFSIFDHLMKGIMLLLAISTLLAVVFSFGVQAEISTSSQRVFRVSNGDDLEFLLAFVGWMPAPLDIAIWHSIWSLSKGNTKTSNEFDFKVGFMVLHYWVFVFSYLVLIQCMGAVFYCRHRPRGLRRNCWKCLPTH